MIPLLFTNLRVLFELRKSKSVKIRQTCSITYNRGIRTLWSDALITGFNICTMLLSASLKPDVTANGVEVHLIALQASCVVLVNELVVIIHSFHRSLLSPVSAGLFKFFLSYGKYSFFIVMKVNFYVNKIESEGKTFQSGAEGLTLRIRIMYLY